MRPTPPPRRAAQAPAGFPPSPTRLQLYRAQMTIRVDSTAELNAATRRAIRIARSLGGFVVSADLRTPEQGEGTSRLVLRVPTTKAQTAFERLAGIGTLVAQRVRLDDLQAGVNRRNERIDDLQAQIAQLERRAAQGEDVDQALAVAPGRAPARAGGRRSGDAPRPPRDVRGHHDHGGCGRGRGAGRRYRARGPSGARACSTTSWRSRSTGSSSAARSCSSPS